jgi:Ca2+-binding RTX toxin-like protein
VHVNVLQLEDETDPDPQVALVSIEPSWVPDLANPVVQVVEYSTDDRDFELLATRGADARYYVVTYSATDASGNVGYASVTVYVGNHRPVAAAGLDLSVNVGEVVQFHGTASSDADGDVLAFTWDFGDGTSGIGATPTHVYADPGIYTVTLTVDDGYFDGTDSDSLTVVVAGAGVSQGVLEVVGTSGDDEVLISRFWGRICVTADFLPGCFHTKKFEADEIERIAVTLDDGNDHLTIALNVGRPATVRGGPGNDWLVGSFSDDILLGEDGDDVLLGSGGNDILIGGPGRDIILGGFGDDIVIAGTSLWDSDDAALLAVMAEWTSDRSFDTRVKNIRGIDNPEFADRLNRNEIEAIDYFFSPDGAGEAGSSTVFDDIERDIVSGGLGHDWLLANTEDEKEDHLDETMDLTFADLVDNLVFVVEPGA